MIWSAGSYALGPTQYRWPARRLCRQETGLLHEAGWTGLGRGAGLIRCLVSFVIYVPFNLVLNVTTFLSPSLLRQLALLRLAAFLVAWVAVVYQAHFSPDFADEIVTAHNIALCSLSAVGFLLHVVLLREQVQAGCQAAGAAELWRGRGSFLAGARGPTIISCICSCCVERWNNSFGFRDEG